MEETSVGFSTETLISAFERMITASIREYPILFGDTVYISVHVFVLLI